MEVLLPLRDVISSAVLKFRMKSSLVCFARCSVAKVIESSLRTCSSFCNYMFTSRLASLSFRILPLHFPSFNRYNLCSVLNIVYIVIIHTALLNLVYAAIRLVQIGIARLVQFLDFLSFTIAKYRGTIYLSIIICLKTLKSRFQGMRRGPVPRIETI